MNEQPRDISPSKAFEGVVGWIVDTVKKERAPGLIVGLSGTDSILTFLACAEAFNRLGKPERVLGLHFQHSSKNEMVDAQKPFACVQSNADWVVAQVLPWLKQKVPLAQLEIDSSIPHSDDNKRWGHLFSRAVNAAKPEHGLSSSYYFPVGTRNATEHALGTYSQLSKGVSMLPIVGLYKSEVLKICNFLGVPKIAIEKSREVDCDCGRFDTQANHMTELDYYIMHKQGLVSSSWLEAHVTKDVLTAVREFYVEETMGNDYRPRTPYMPKPVI